MRRQRGFTLLEVMLGLALLGLGLTVLIKSAAGSIYSAQQAHMMGVVTDLARGKMYDLEEGLLKDGFSDTEQHEDEKTFEEEGWPTIHYAYKIEEVELPGWEQLQALSQAHAAGSAGSGSAGSGSAGSDKGGFDSGGGFGDSALGGMLSQFGGFGGSSGGGTGSGSNIDAAQGGAFVQAQYTMFQQILKVSIRKVSLTVTWQVMGSERDMKVVAFFTDAGAMDKVISGMGSTDLPDAGSGSGSGSARGGTSGGTSGGTGSGSQRKP
ncbi:MAG: prepilin-type N-terminal cleavage/methylation domain-containing protein [Kofleriaceae bacterium]